LVTEKSQSLAALLARRMGMPKSREIEESSVFACPHCTERYWVSIRERPFEIVEQLIARPVARE
jgi:hypothetical protein